MFTPDINSDAVREEMIWLSRIIAFRLSVHEKREYSETDPQTGTWLKRQYLTDIEVPRLHPDSALQSFFMQHEEYEFVDRILIALALAVHVHPSVFNQLLKYRYTNEVGIPQAGGIQTSQWQGFIPTGVTWLWLISCGNPAIYARQLSRLFNEHPALRDEIVSMGNWTEEEPSGSGPLRLNREFLLKVICLTPNNHV